MQFQLPHVQGSGGMLQGKETKLTLSPVAQCLVAQLCATPCTVARQAPLSLGFSRQEYWSGLPFSSPEELPNPGIDLWSPALEADSLPFELLLLLSRFSHVRL